MFKILRSKDSSSSPKKAGPEPPNGKVDDCSQARLDPRLKVLRSPPDANIDVVALHGLGGGSLSTWTSGQTNWLKDDDMLAAILPRARIMTFGYNANAALSTNPADLRVYAVQFVRELNLKRNVDSLSHRPLLFIGHSLGGIVIKQALIIAHADPEFTDISSSTRGVVFMGTPHRGTATATWAKLFASIVSAVLDPSIEILRDLEENSPELQRITFGWKNVYTNLQIASCYELETTKVNTPRLRPNVERSGIVIVDRTSALLDYPGERQIPMNANHLTICKFKSKDDPNFKLLASALKEMSTVIGPRVGYWVKAVLAPSNRQMELLRKLKGEGSTNIKYLLAATGLPW